MPIAKIRKSENSTVLVIPPEVIEEKNLHIGEAVEYLILKKKQHKNIKKRLSFADCIGYAAARKFGVKFVTGDYMFKGLEGVEFVK